MDWNPPHEWDGLREALASLLGLLPAEPRAILVISAHWESEVFEIESAPAPGLIYDYGGFPPHTYELTHSAPGDPALAAEIDALLTGAGIDHRMHPDRGWDHGVFIPLKVMDPEARIPIVAMSVRRDLDPIAHLELGRALAPLREQGVFILGSGFSFHNFATFGSPKAQVFDDWLQGVMTSDARTRWDALAHWADAPTARNAHAREEHLIPLMVAAGAADDVPARRFFSSRVLDTPTSCWLFD
jgi:aromatic ring-opening dioxygenase catalytic subunit (LigB family)